MRFIIYCRKSSETEDKQVLSLESQEKELLEIAKRDNLEIVQIFTEKMSAKEPGRPVFNKVISILSTGKIDGILCWKIDRLTRNPIDGGQIQWLLQSGKIKCIATFDKNYYPTDNVLLMSIEQAMATQYIRDLSMNVKRGNRTKLEKGEWPSRAPFGYINDRVNKTIKIDKKAASYVKRAFDLYSCGGYTLKELCNLLHTEGLRSSSGKKVHKSKLHNFFTNKFYIGLMERGDKSYVGNHKGIVSVSTFEKVQDVLYNRKHPRPKKHFYSARGFLSCGSCGCALTGDTKKGHIYYYCTNGKRNCNQHKKYMRSEFIDTILSSMLQELSFDTESIELMAAAYQEKHTDRDNYITKAIENHTNELQRLLDKELALVDGFSSNLIRKDLYEVKMEEIEQNKNLLNLQIKELNGNQDKFLLTFEQATNLFLHCSRASELYLTLSESEKRNILKTLLSNATIENENIVKYQFKSPFDLIAKTPKNASISLMLALCDDIRKVDVTSHSTTLFNHTEAP